MEKKPMVIAKEQENRHPVLASRRNDKDWGAKWVGLCDRIAWLVDVDDMHCCALRDGDVPSPPARVTEGSDAHDLGIGIQCLMRKNHRGDLALAGFVRHQTHIKAEQWARAVASALRCSSGL
jgi:hypothetical protein